MTTTHNPTPPPTSAAPFAVRLSVRLYELDALGHLNDAVYVQWADHARARYCAAAGASLRDLAAAGVAPVNLETTIRYHRELQEGDEVDVTCVVVWGDGKTFRVDQEFRREDGTLAAELSSVVGLFDLRERRLVADPAIVMRSIATHPEALGIA